MIYIQTIQMSERQPIDATQFVLSYAPAIGWELFHQGISYGSSRNPQAWLKIWYNDVLITENQSEKDLT